MILRRTDVLRYAPDGMLGDRDPPDLLRRIIITGRSRTAALDDPPLQENPIRPGSLAWRLEADGRQCPVLELAEDLLGLGVPAHVAARLLLAPSIPAEAAPLVVAELGRQLAAAAAAVALPETLDTP